MPDSDKTDHKDALKMQDKFYKMSYRDTFTDSPAGAQNLPVSSSEYFKSIDIMGDAVESDRLILDDEQIQLNQVK